MDPTTAAVLLEQSPDAVIFAGIDGLITVWNPAAQRVFGFAPAEAIGQRLDIIVPEQFRSAHWTGYDRALEAGWQPIDLVRLLHLHFDPDPSPPRGSARLLVDGRLSG